MKISKPVKITMIGVGIAFLLLIPLFLGLIRSALPILKDSDFSEQDLRCKTDTDCKIVIVASETGCTSIAVNKKAAALRMFKKEPVCFLGHSYLASCFEGRCAQVPNI